MYKYIFKVYIYVYMLLKIIIVFTLFNSAGTVILTFGDLSSFGANLFITAP